ncbi:MAG: YHS domain-containing protein [Burkholderiaceae bacterium]|nr:YHS domain-containing protein [Burkholderiaceae bacterium]
MQWLTQNWIWIVFAIGVFLLMRRGGMGHGRSHGNDGPAQHHEDSSDSQSKDPVSGERVNPETAVNVMYQGRVYYFASRENREKFEASPAQYAASATGRHHRRHGC